MAFKDFIQKGASKGTPLDTTGASNGSRPYTTFREFMEQQDKSPQMDAQTVKGVAKADAPQEPKEAPEDAHIIRDSEGRALAYTTPDEEPQAPSFPAARRTNEPTMFTMDSMAPKKGESKGFIYGDAEQDKKAAKALELMYKQQNLTDETKENLKDVARDEALPLTATLLAGAFTGGLGFLGGVAVRAGGAAAGEAAEQLLKKEDVISFSQDEQPWETQGEFFQRVGTEAGLSVIGDVAASGVKLAFRGAREGVKNAVIGKLRPGAENVVAKLKAGDPRLANVGITQLVDSSLADTGEAILRNSTVTGNYANRRYMQSQKQVQDIFFGVGDKDTRGEAYEMLDKNIRASLEAGETTKEGLSTLSDDLVEQRTRRWEREVSTLETKEAQLRKRADTLNLTNLDKHLSMTEDEIVKSGILKSLSKNPDHQALFYELKDVVEKKTLRKKALQDFNEHVKFTEKRAEVFDKRARGETLGPDEQAILDTSLDDVVEKNIEASVEELLEKQNDLGRAMTIHKALKDASSYADVIGNQYYEPLKETMKDVESMIGGVIDLRSVREKAIKESKRVQELSGRFPEADNLKTLKSDMYTYEDAHFVVRNMKQVAHKLFKAGDKEEAKFINGLVKETEEKIKSGLDTAEKMLEMEGKQLQMADGSMIGEGALRNSYDTANRLYSDTMKDYNNTLIQSIIRTSDTEQGAANQVMATVLQSPNAMKVLTEYLNKSAQRRAEEGLMGSTVTGEVHATLKAGAIHQLFNPKQIEGQTFYVPNENAMQQYGEALDYLFSAEEKQNIRTWMDYFGSIDAASKSKTFQYTQKALEYRKVIGLLKAGGAVAVGATGGGAALAGAVGGAVAGAGALKGLGKFFYSNAGRKWFTESVALDLADPVIWKNQRDELEGIVSAMYARTLNDPDSIPTEEKGTLIEEHPEASEFGLSLAERLKKKYGDPEEPQGEPQGDTMKADLSGLRERLEARYK